MSKLNNKGTGEQNPYIRLWKRTLVGTLKCTEIVEGWSCLAQTWLLQTEVQALTVQKLGVFSRPREWCVRAADDRGQQTRQLDWERSATKGRSVFGRNSTLG